MESESEAGPSRPRRTPPPPSTPQHSDMESSTDGDARSSSRRTTSRPASPETAFQSRLSRPASPDQPLSPHLDLAAYPTATLLRLIANLLQQIASANDHIRPSDTEDVDDDMGEHTQSQSSRSGSRASSATPQGTGVPIPSPTSALFSERDTFPTVTTKSSGGIDPSSPLPLFSASRTSLMHHSSLLSFHARHVPSISIEAYLLRILKYCPTTNEVFLSLLVYFDRMSRLGTASGVGAGLVGRNGKGFAIDSFNVHRLVIAGVTVASKFFSDVFYTNSRYAKVGGLPPHELNQLELQFLLLNDFRLAIPTDEMQRYGDRLLSFWQDREAETGVDVETGRELSEEGKKRAKERKEEQQKLETKGEETTTSEQVSREQSSEGMEVDQPNTSNGSEEGTESHPKDPAQPPPDPAETASAPLQAVDATQAVQPSETINDSAASQIPNPPKHAATAPLPVSSSSSSEALSSPSTVVKTPNNGVKVESAGSVCTPNGTRTKERSSSVHSSTPQRSVSFSRSNGGIGRGWGGGEQGVVAVSGTG